MDQAQVDSDLDRIREIVRGAIGFDEVRGDVVTVVSTAFARPVEELPEDLGISRRKFRFVYQDCFGNCHTFLNIFSAS